MIGPGPEIRLNGVRYCWPDRPVVVVCNDGGDPDYFDRALKDGIVPNVARFMQTGFMRTSVEALTRKPDNDGDRFGAPH